MIRFFWIFILLAICTRTEAFDGCYVGLSGGATVLSGIQTGSSRGVGAADVLLDLHADVFDPAFDGTFFTGFGWQYCRFFAGFEGFVRYAHHDFSHDKRSDLLLLSSGGSTDFINHNSTKIEAGAWHFGSDFRLGYILNPELLLYGRIGTEWSKVSFKNRFVFLEDTLAFTRVTALKTSHKDWGPHLRAGIGIEKYLWDSLVFRADYVFTHYKGIQVERTEVIDSVVLSNQTKLNLNDHALLLGLSYYFEQNCRYCYPAYPCDPFFGFYLAAGIGGTLLDGRVKSLLESFVTLAGDTRISTVSSPSRISDVFFDGILYAGYGVRWRCLYAGVEAFLQASPIHKTREDNAILRDGASLRDTIFTTHLEIKPLQFGGDFRAGLILGNSTLFYGFIGTSYARSKLRLEESIHFVNPNFDFRRDFSKKLRGATLRVGGGFEYAICPCWNLRAEYIFTAYGRLIIDDFASAAVGGAVGTLGADLRVRLFTHSATLGLVRYF